MAGYTDRAMRLVCREQGAAFATTGAILDKSATAPGVLDLPEFTVTKKDHPLAAQIIGHDPTKMADAAQALSDKGYDAIDINFACPVRKVLARKRGGWLMSNSDHAIEIFSHVRTATSLPLIVKLRRGFDDSAQSTRHFWRIIEYLAGNGVNAVILHGRTVEQLYRGKADWSAISEVKRRFPSLTVIGSGDIKDAETAVERLRSGNVDGISIGRGAVGDPWIFARTLALLNGGTVVPPPNITEQRKMLERHLSLACEIYDFKKAMLKLRNVWIRYARHHAHRKNVQQDLMQALTPHEWETAIERWYA